MGQKSKELSAEVSDDDLLLLASVYNDCLSKIDPFRYNLKFTDGFRNKPWYNDLLSLLRVINKLGAKPREYIQAQLNEYKPALKLSRRVPTIRMMASDEGIERYNSYLGKRGRGESTVVIVKANMMEFADVALHKMMATYKIDTVQDIFKDPFLMRQLPLQYVKKHPAYVELCNSHYYEKEFGVEGIELLS
jgi:hypothetical protein